MGGDRHVSIIIIDTRVEIRVSDDPDAQGATIRLTFRTGCMPEEGLGYGLVASVLARSAL